MQNTVTAASAPYCRACHTSLDPAVSRGSKNGFNLLPCPSCGTVTVHPFPSLDDIIKFYQSYKGSAVYKPKEEKKIRRASRRIKRLLSYTAGRRFLDVGCNIGYTVKAALNLGLDARGIDMDAAAVQTANETYGPRFEALSIESYAALGHKVDILYTSEVIEHVPDPDSFMTAVHSLLDDNGVLYMTMPDGGHWNIPRDFASWRMVTPPSHIIYFTRKGIRHLLEKHGFKIEKFFFTLKPGIRLIARKKG
jgi:2-polyprenyl-3-methyl-5-hydroxy-6-metoxy-1,4-benzoquinol methylase